MGRTKGFKFDRNSEKYKRLAEQARALSRNRIGTGKGNGAQIRVGKDTADRLIAAIPSPSKRRAWLDQTINGALDHLTSPRVP